MYGENLSEEEIKYFEKMGIFETYKDAIKADAERKRKGISFKKKAQPWYMTAGFIYNIIGTICCIGVVTCCIFCYHIAKETINLTHSGNQVDDENETEVQFQMANITNPDDSRLDQTFEEDSDGDQPKAEYRH